MKTFEYRLYVSLLKKATENEEKRNNGEQS